MAFISFPIAHSPHPVNHPSYVFPITLLILQNDTPDIVSPPTYYVTRTTLRLPETFALLPHLPPSTFGTKVPCLPIQPMHPVLMCSTSYPVLRRSVDAPADTKAHVDSPSAAPIPYSSVSRETCEDHPRAQLRGRERERESSTCARAASLACSCVARALVSASLRRRRSRTGERTTGIVVPPSGARLLPTHVFHVKPASTDQPSAPPPRGDCRARAVSEVCQYNPLLPPPNSK